MTLFVCKKCGYLNSRIPGGVNETVECDRCKGERHVSTCSVCEHSPGGGRVCQNLDLIRYKECKVNDKVNCPKCRGVGTLMVRDYWDYKITRCYQCREPL